MTEQKNKYLAAILVRGMIGSRQDVKDTLRMLNLQKKNSCTIVANNAVNKGMMNKCKDYITYGEISEEAIKEIEAKREKQNNHFALQPPRGGFERMGIKTPYSTKGALGYRGDKIIDLIRKML